MKRVKIIFADWLIGILLTLLILGGFLINWYPLLALEYKTYDFRARLRQKKVSTPVVVVAIDDLSIANLGRWPWPRAYMAEMIDLLSGYGAKIIGINILYTEPDQNSGLMEIKAIKEKVEGLPGYRSNSQLAGIYDLITQSEQRLDNDAILSDSIDSAKNVILPLSFDIGEQIGNPDPNVPDYLKKNSADTPVSNPYIQGREVLVPIPEFVFGSLALGHINLLADEDGTIRREPLLIQHKGRLYPSFAMHTVMKYLNYNVSDIGIANGIRIGKVNIPSDKKQRMLITYNGKFGTFPYYSFFDVINNKVPPDVFKDKIVLIGHTATGIATLEVTPAEHNFPAIEIEANVIENILNKNFISRPGWAFYIEIGVIILFGIFLSFLIPRLKAGISAIISVVLLLIWNGAAIYLFVLNGYWLMLLPPTLLLGLGYTVIMSKRYMITEKRKELVESDSIETNKMLGLSFQGQGMLDLAFEKFRKCPVEDEAVKELLYNLALDFERKRMFNKAAAVYEHILKVGDFKDIKDRIKKLKVAGETMIFGMTGAKKDATILMEGAETTPTLGRYEIQKELGRGAMGTVFLGKDPKINRLVAIKTMRFDEIEQDQLDETKKRFFREAEAAGTLSHPNIVTIYDAGEEHDVAYVAMELLDGQDLSAFATKENKLPIKETLRIISSVAGGLDYAHSKGIVHRDIKPANIMLLKNGEVKIADFGIARVIATSKTQTGVVLGTPSYMSPEQVLGKKVDGRSDLFSLGVVFYELLSIEKPFGGDSIATLMYNIANKPPMLITKLSADIPECCAYIVHKLLAKNIEKRYQQGKEVVRDIDICLKKIK
ncbi:MAG: CHASE2 domain-containing protein [Nitrospirae bacterium]|nr:CHASE2 domain-containing protein [Nitrospirota bacterium]